MAKYEFLPLSGRLIILLLSISSGIITSDSVVGQVLPYYREPITAARTSSDQNTVGIAQTTLEQTPIEVHHTFQSISSSPVPQLDDLQPYRLAQVFEGMNVPGRYPDGGPNLCPGQFVWSPEIYPPGQVRTCLCFPDDANWNTLSFIGTDIYHFEANICRAAIHAGISIPLEGRFVTIQVLPGQSSYLGSDRNGVKSRSLDGLRPKYLTEIRSFKFVNAADTLPQPAAQEEEKAECKEPISPSSNKIGLDRWWATKGQDPIPVTWTVKVPSDGEYKLNIGIENLNDWKLTQDAEVTIDSKTSEKLGSVRGTADLGCLRAGIHSLKINGFKVPANPIVEKITFQLNGGSAPEELVALFVADHTAPDAGTKYNVSINGKVTELNASNLVNQFAPILHFDTGDESQAPIGVDATFRQSNIIEKDSNTQTRSGDSKTYIKKWNLSEAKVYASILEDTRITPGRGAYPPTYKELAINYYFHYPLSNWEKYGGFNTHEGDWEGITLFLKWNKNQWVPERIVFAQHANAEIVRWDSRILGPEQRPQVYVGLGGHASYPEPGIDDVFVPRLERRPESHWGRGKKFDSKGSVEYLPRASNAVGEVWDIGKEMAWLLYPGTWGNPDLNNDGSPTGDGAPRGPIFLDNTYHVTESIGRGERWLDPWSWSYGIRSKTFDIDRHFEKQE